MLMGFPLVTSANESEKGIGDWLFFLSPAKTTFQTTKKLSEVEEVIDFYKKSALNGDFLELGINTGFSQVEIKGDKITIILFKNSLGSVGEAFKLKIKPKGEDEFLEVKARAVYSHLVKLYEQDAGQLSRFEFSREIEDLASELFGAVEGL